jgi:hypothetical protein
MRWQFWRKQVRDVEVARAERRRSERQLEIDKREVIRPLHELRETNHVAEMITELIQRKTGGSSA